jgi:L-rhamnose mutarotase
MKRMGMVIKPEYIAEYKRTHAAVWPEVLARISDSNIRNYTIFLREPENLLFAYCEYHGEDWAADAKKMAADAQPGMVGDPRSHAGAARDSQGG